MRGLPPRAVWDRSAGLAGLTVVPLFAALAPAHRRS